MRHLANVEHLNFREPEIAAVIKHGYRNFVNIKCNLQTIHHHHTFFKSATVNLLLFFKKKNILPESRKFFAFINRFNFIIFSAFPENFSSKQYSGCFYSPALQSSQPAIKMVNSGLFFSFQLAIHYIM